MTHKHGHVYELTNCEDCRVAFVRSARPDRRRQESFIAYLVRYHKADHESLLQALRK